MLAFETSVLAPYWVDGPPLGILTSTLMLTTMKKLFLFLLLLAAGTLPRPALAQALLRVNNTAGVTGPGIFTTLQAAHNAAAVGDIIYLEPSVQSYGDLQCVKRLTIIGNGYFLGDNPGLQIDTRTAVVGAVTFGAGSAGSRITGCTMVGNFHINTDNIVVERNNIQPNCHIGRHFTTGVASGVINQGIIRQNYINSNILFLADAASSVNNILITNNIIGGNIGGGIPTAPMSALIKNNVLSTGGSSTFDVVNCIITNNVMLGGSAYVSAGRNNTASFNISDNTAFGTLDNNQAGVSGSLVFLGTATTSTDGAFQLKPGTNPARGAGEGGADIGPYGGTTPYRLLGIPNVPTVFQYSQTVTGSNLNAVISTKSNN